MSFLCNRFLILVLALFAAACGEEAMTSFNGNHECDGNVCSNDACNTDKDCASNEFCASNGQCQAKAAPQCRLNSDCNDNQFCNSVGKCEANFDCRGIDMCDHGYTCNQSNGQCFPTPVCTPDCIGAECGPDGCGGQCGTCGGTESCTVTGLCVPSNNSDDCRVNNACANGQSCNQATGKCDGGSGGAYAHELCITASVVIQGAYGGQTLTLDAEKTTDWTYAGSASEGKWYPKGANTFCRGVSAGVRGARVLVEIESGDYPGHVGKPGSEVYSLPMTIYATWDGGNKMSGDISSQDCSNKQVNKAVCLLNKGKTNNVYGVVFPSPWQ